MEIVVRGKTHRFENTNPVRISEERVEAMAQEVANIMMLHPEFDDYFTSTGDVKVSAHRDSMMIEFEISRPEKVLFLYKKDWVK